MIDLLIIAVLILVLYPWTKDDKYKEMDRQRAMRHAMSRLQEKYRRFSL